MQFFYQMFEIHTFFKLRFLKLIIKYVFFIFAIKIGNGIGKQNIFWEVKISHSEKIIFRINTFNPFFLIKLIFLIKQKK